MIASKPCTTRVAELAVMIPRVIGTLRAEPQRLESATGSSGLTRDRLVAAAVLAAANDHL
ncbi:hypothetical protein OM076_43690 [Solirubrobacter ginsenosidimutans]|uniref:Uncharacterized protein n=1 Tax=Solirubrobacter ginsenosidimutans TaxID=490573 RepID=A0A9X3N9A1_9ACTN|nr:hypothetical protein [Solirubrobacter ginsenosidimutans]